MAGVDDVHVHQPDGFRGGLFARRAPASPGHGGAGHATLSECGAAESGIRTQVSAAY